MNNKNNKRKASATLWAFCKDMLKPVLIGAVISGGIVVFFSRGSRRPILHHLSNGFFSAGVLIAGVGLLLVIHSSGFFDLAQFGFKQLGAMVKHSFSRNTVYEKIDTDFLHYKEEKARERTAPWQSVIVGFLYIGASVVVLQWL